MNVFSELKGFLKIKHISIDNKLFQLHYKVTSITLLAFSAVLASKQHFGNPIECLSDTTVYSKTDDMKDLLNTYCWVQSTYTVPDLLNGTIGQDIIYPGVGPSNIRSQKRIHHKYYQWIVFLLFFQGLAFLTPHFIWKICESAKMKMLSFELTSPMQAEDVNTSRRKLLQVYFTSNLGHHNTYANCYFLCEVFNLVNVVAQIWITDLILGKEFRNYGSDVIKYMGHKRINQGQRQVDPMSKLFPRVTKCNLRVYGGGGNIQSHDAICMLPLNIINEKIYIVLWFWFLFLLLVSSLGLVYRCLTIVSPTVRYFLLKARARLNESKSVQNICKRCNFADWFVLYQLSKNIDSLAFKQLISDLEMTFMPVDPEIEQLLTEKTQMIPKTANAPTVSPNVESAMIIPPPPPPPPMVPSAIHSVVSQNLKVARKIITDV